MAKSFVLFLVILLAEGGAMGQQREFGNRRDGAGATGDRSTHVTDDRGTRTPATPQTPNRPPPEPVKPTQACPVPMTIVNNNISVIVTNVPQRPDEQGEVFLLDYRQRPDDAGFDFSEDEVVRFDDPNADLFYEYSDGYYYINIIDGGDIVDVGKELPSGTGIPTEMWKRRKDIRLDVGHSYVIRTPNEEVYSFRVVRLSSRFVVFRDVVLQTGSEENNLSTSISDLDREKPGGSRFGR
jgi:hypothetical protein